MSKRYGRNQKNQHRAQISALQAALDKLKVDIEAKEFGGKATNEPSLDGFVVLRREVSTVEDAREKRKTIWLTLDYTPELRTWYRKLSGQVVQYEGRRYFMRDFELRQGLDSAFSETRMAVSTQLVSIL